MITKQPYKVQPRIQCSWQTDYLILILRQYCLSPITRAALALIAIIKASSSPESHPNPEVEANLELTGVSKTSFEKPAVQTAFKESIASLLAADGVVPEDVIIDGVDEVEVARRALKIVIRFTIRVKDAAAGQSSAAALNPEATQNPV